MDSSNKRVRKVASESVPMRRRSCGHASRRPRGRIARSIVPCPSQITIRRHGCFGQSDPPLPDRHADNGGSAFANTLTYVCEHNPEGALGIVINRPIDMTLSALFEQIDIPLARRRAARIAGALRRSRADRSRLRAASAARQLAIHAGDQRRHGAYDVEGRARGCRVAAKGRRTCSFRWATPAGPRASSSRRSRKTPGSPSPPIPTCCSILPAEGRLPAAMRLLGIDFSRLSDDVGHA